MTFANTEHLNLPSTLYWDRQRIISKIPVTLKADPSITVMRLALPVLAGDVLDIYADWRVTNDVGRAADGTVTGVRFICGVGWRIKKYNASAPSGAARDATWEEIGQPLGENCTVDTHHLAMNIGQVYTVPDSWVPGDQMGIALQANCHSTLALRNGGDAITVDDLGILKVRRDRADASEGI